MSQPLADPLPFATFGAALKFLRKRARLTQDELGRAVGYGREQIARLENGSRLPDLTVLAALFVPALELQREPLLVTRLLELAAAARHDKDPADDAVRITVTHATQRRVEVRQTILEPVFPGAHGAGTIHRPPAPLLPLIGRQDAVAQACTLLRGDARLLTLVGPPGVGKTRLALEIGRQLAAEFAHGAGWVPLASVQRDDDLAAAVAAALAIHPGPAQTPAEAVRAYLASHALLLVLDNFEHLLAAAPQVSTWLQLAPQLKILSTSRTALDLYGEYEMAVAPLALPSLAHLPPPGELAQVSAVKLFAERAGAVDMDFRLNAENALAVAGLCVALDGLPLAIELAGARVRTLTPQILLHQIVAARQHHRPVDTLLAQSKRGVDERHRTLQEAIDWSYRLLAPGDQAVLARLGIFVGGCTMAAAASICGATPANVQALVQANLLQTEQDVADETGSTVRLGLLETLRTFAVEQLITQETLAAIQALHADYFAVYAQNIFAGLLGEEQALWMQRALRDHDNLRAALRFALHEGCGEIAVAIAGGLWWFWNRQGLLREGSAWLEASLNCPPQEDPPGDRYRQHRSRALNGAGSLATELGDFANALRYHQEGLALRRALGDHAGAADVLHNLALTARCQGDFAQALQWFEESLALMVQLGHAAESDVMGCVNIGITHFEMGNPGLGRPWLETALASARSQRDGWRTAYVAANLANLLLAQGELARAEQLAQESVQDFERLGDQFFLAEALLVLAKVTARRGTRQQAHELCRKVLDLYRAIDDRHGIANVLQAQAWLALGDGDQTDRPDPADPTDLAARKDLARRLFEQACTLRTAVPRAIAPHEQAEYERLRKALDD